MKKLFTLLTTLIFSLCISISVLAAEPQAEQTVRDGKVTLSDNLKTHYQKLKEYSVVEFPFLKPNTTILVSNDCPTRYNQPVKHVIIYFYKEKVAMFNYEFKNPSSKEAIIEAVNKECSNLLFTKKHNKETKGNYTRDVYEWDSPIAGIVLNHRSHPVTGDSLTLSYVVKGIIDDPTYLKGDLPQIPDM